MRRNIVLEMELSSGRCKIKIQLVLKTTFDSLLIDKMIYFIYFDNILNFFIYFYY